jgi:hypothetical protein
MRRRRRLPLPELLIHLLREICHLQLSGIKLTLLFKMFTMGNKILLTLTTGLILIESFLSQKGSLIHHLKVTDRAQLFGIKLI